MDNRLIHMLRSARQAGKILRRYFGETLETSVKTSITDLQTKADVEAEERILSILKEEYPKYNIHSEERGFEDKGSEYTFVIDPMDGTNNFSLGIPNISISIALMHRDVTLSAVVHSPFLEGTYYATRGDGAFFDGLRVYASTETDISKSTIITSKGYGSSLKFERELTKGLHEKQTKRILNPWSTAYTMALIGAGHIEGMVSCGAEIYDIVAAKLIAREAGALITNLEGGIDTDQNNSFIVACTKEVQKELIEICKKAKE